MKNDNINKLLDSVFSRYSSCFIDVTISYISKPKSITMRMGYEGKESEIKKAIQDIFDKEKITGWVIKFE